MAMLNNTNVGVQAPQIQIQQRKCSQEISNIKQERSSMIVWDELQYCSLSSQASMYSLAHFNTAGEHRILVSCLQAKVLSVSVQNKLPTAQQLAFTYIASNAEIISIDAFNHSGHDSVPGGRKHSKAGAAGIVVAIAFTKCNEGGIDRRSYLNIYCEWERGYEADLDRVSEGCQSIALDFVPYQLYHVRLGHSEGETVFLLSGSDQKIHLYKEARNTHMFVQYPVDDYFPEMSTLPSVVLCMQCSYKGDSRVTVLGCQNGSVLLYITNIYTKEVRSYRVQHDSPISSVQIFSSVSNHMMSSHHHHHHHKSTRKEDWRTSLLSAQHNNNGGGKDVDDVNILVCPTLECSLVYTRADTVGLTESCQLSDSDSADCVITSLIADIDCDGQNEIILGTYGQELLMYKQTQNSTVDKAESSNQNSHLSTNQTPAYNDSDPTTNQNTATESTEKCSANQNVPSDTVEKILTNENRDTNTVTNQHSANCESEIVDGVNRVDYELIGRRVMPDPVLDLFYEDITNDGVKELIVLTLNGLHILQHDVNSVMRLIEERLRKALSQTLKHL